ncbi:MAG: ATP-binding cassette domain-containing protein [Bacilli bacterium]|nr:ATP-binding cassette domain-containing protein [Bacilli bacterium]
MKIVKQDGYMDCGVSCLLSIIRYYDGNIPIEYLREKTNTTKDGVTAYKLVEFAKEIGFESYGLKGTLNELKEEDLPIIAHVIINKNLKHFIVIYKKDSISKKLMIMDPDKGKKKISFSEFNLITTNNFIYLKPIKKLPLFYSQKIVNQSIKKFALKNKSYITYMIILSSLNFILALVCSFHFTFIINNGINFNVKENVFLITKLIIYIFILKNISELLKDKTSIKFSILFDLYITKMYYKKLIFLPYIYYRNRTTGEIVSRMEDLNVIKEFLTNLSVTLLTDFIIIIFFLIFLFRTNKKIFYITILLIVIIFIIEYINNRILNIKINNYKSNNDKLNTHFIESLEKSNTIKNLHIENKTIKKFNYIYDKVVKSIFEISNLSLINKFTKKSLIDSFYIIFFLLLSNRVIDNKMTIGMIIILENILKYFLDSYTRVLSLFKDMYKFKISKNRIDNLFMIREENFSCTDYFKDKKLLGNIRFNKLNYSFNSTKLFDNLDLTIKRGEKIFFFGKSGTGKSTLMKMLVRYVDVDFGMISINNIDINHHHLEVLRKRISYVGGDEKLFKDTIKNNILLDREISYEMFEKVTEITLSDKIIEEKDSKINSIPKDIYSLSGGERQRIILGRTILNDSDIYIFDEALSQIDENSERIILKNIFEYLKNKTVIVISHRMTNKDLYTKIISLRDGKICEEI